jgi:hypothetical protein
MKNVRVHFKKWEPVGKMEGYNSKMGTMEEYNFKMGADIKLYWYSSKNWRGSKIATSTHVKLCVEMTVGSASFKISLLVSTTTLQIKKYQPSCVKARHLNPNTIINLL